MSVFIWDQVEFIPFRLQVKTLKLTRHHLKMCYCIWVDVHWSGVAIHTYGFWIIRFKWTRSTVANQCIECFTKRNTTRLIDCDCFDSIGIFHCLKELGSMIPTSIPFVLGMDWILIQIDKEIATVSRVIIVYANVSCSKTQLSFLPRILVGHLSDYLHLPVSIPTSGLLQPRDNT